MDKREFACPALISDLQEIYGEDFKKKEINPQDFPDIDKFIQDKDECQRKSNKISFVFE